MRPKISSFAAAKKVPSPWNKLVCAEMIFKTMGGFFFFLNKCVSRYLSFGDFKVPNNCSHNKIINKIRSTKNQENSACHFGDNYLTNHLVKFLQVRIKPWRIGALRVCTGYHFCLRKSLRAFKSPLTFHVIHVNNTH